MKSLAKTFGVAARNFTAYPEMPSAKALVEYGVRVEELGYNLVWVWDHILFGVEPNFPIVDSLTVLTRNRRPHEPFESRDWRPRPASAQPGHARQAALEHRPSFGGPADHGDGLRLV